MSSSAGAPRVFDRRTVVTFDRASAMLFRCLAAERGHLMSTKATACSYHDRLLRSRAIGSGRPHSSSNATPSAMWSPRGAWCGPAGPDWRYAIDAAGCHRAGQSLPTGRLRLPRRRVARSLRRPASRLYFFLPFRRLPGPCQRTGPPWLAIVRRASPKFLRAASVVGCRGPRTCSMTLRVARYSAIAAG